MDSNNKRKNIQTLIIIAIELLISVPGWTILSGIRNPSWFTDEYTRMIFTTITLVATCMFFLTVLDQSENEKESQKETEESKEEKQKLIKEYERELRIIKMSLLDDIKKVEELDKKLKK